MGFVLYALVPVFIGLSAPLWFGKMIPSVRRLRRGAKWIDDQTPTFPASPVTVKSLREHDKCGDKIVVAHHLGKWTRDLERKILHALSFNGGATLVLVAVIAVKNNTALHSPKATFGDFLNAVIDNWQVSLGLALSLIEILIVLKLVSDVAAKYSDVIDAARPQREKFFARIFHRSTTPHTIA